VVLFLNSSFISIIEHYYFLQNDLHLHIPANQASPVFMDADEMRFE